MYDISQNAKGDVTGEKSNSVNLSDDNQFDEKLAYPYYDVQQTVHILS